MELNWVRNFDKSLVMPEVVFVHTERVGGCYYSPEKTEIELEGKFYPLDFGLIVVSSVWPEDFQATIAHEWRHHWQRFHGWKLDSIGWNCPSEDEYESKIKEYFTKSKSEMDALLFQFKKAPESTSDLWKSIFNLSRKSTLVMN